MAPTAVHATRGAIAATPRSRKALGVRPPLGTGVRTSMTASAFREVVGTGCLPRGPSELARHVQRRVAKGSAPPPSSLRGQPSLSRATRESSVARSVSTPSCRFGQVKIPKMGEVRARAVVVGATGVLEEPDAHHAHGTAS